MSLDTVARFDMTRPAHHGRYAVGAFPVGVLFAAERRHAGIGPGVHMRTIVGAVHDDGVVGDAQLVDLVEHGADVFVMVDHRIVIRALPASGLAQALGFGMGAEMHVSKVDPNEHRFSGLGLFFDKFGGTSGGIIIDSLHALFGQRTGVLDLAIGKAVNDAARSKFLAEFGVLRIIREFRFFFGIQMIEVAVELVETMIGRQEFILVAQVILAELAGGIALGFQ